MRQATGTRKSLGEKLRIVLDGLRGEGSLGHCHDQGGFYRYFTSFNAVSDFQISA